ncbi:MAG: nucleotide exchange factor GrpE [Candidatus Micrarchaeota archaeon]
MSLIEKEPASTVVDGAQKETKPQKAVKNEENTGLKPLESNQSVEKKVTELQKQLDEMTELVQRNRAEFENFQKRMDREKPVLVAGGQFQTLLAFLPVFESFEQALEKAGPAEKKVLEPVQIQFVKTLQKMGVMEMKCVGKPFDPHRQECLLTASDPKQAEGVVLEELQKGFFWNGQVLRHAKVKINHLEKSSAEAV